MGFIEEPTAAREPTGAAQVFALGDGLKKAWGSLDAKDAEVGLGATAEGAPKPKLKEGKAAAVVTAVAGGVTLKKLNDDTAPGTVIAGSPKAAVDTGAAAAVAGGTLPKKLKDAAGATEVAPDSVKGTEAAAPNPKLKEVVFPASAANGKVPPTTGRANFATSEPNPKVAFIAGAAAVAVGAACGFGCSQHTHADAESTLKTRHVLHLHGKGGAL